uniref:Sn-2 protein n=1 Tax=Solanum tuberosum TaxID=4113 RepID=M1B0C1_SOLTU
MGLKGKLIASMEVKCGGHLINDLMHTNTHQAANISPTINHFEVHKGEIGKVGTIINMKYNEDNALVTRSLVIVCTIFTIIFGVRGCGNQLGWSYQKKWQKKKMKEKK